MVQEHMHERVAVPGFRRGSRYRAVDPGPQAYFTLYEVDSVSVLSSDAYREAGERRSEWTERMLPHFRSLERIACTVVAQVGTGSGGELATIRVRPEGRALAELRPAVVALVEEALAAHPRPTGLRVLESDGKPVRGSESADAAPELLILVEAAGRDAIDVALAVLVPSLAKLTAAEPRAQRFDLSFTLTDDHGG
jgi:hypothetical protein